MMGPRITHRAMSSFRERRSAWAAGLGQAWHRVSQVLRDGGMWQRNVGLPQVDPDGAACPLTGKRFQFYEWTDRAAHREGDPGLGAGFLSPDSTDIWDQMILCFEGLSCAPGDV